MSRDEEVAELLTGKCRQFERRFRDRRIEELVADFYLPDGVLEGRDMPPHAGHEALRSILLDAREVYSMIEIDLDPVTVVGSVAFGSFTNRNILPDEEIEIHRGIMIWREVDGSWRVARDFFFAEDHLSASLQSIATPR